MEAVFTSSENGGGKADILAKARSKDLEKQNDLHLGSESGPPDFQHYVKDEDGHNNDLEKGEAGATHTGHRKAVRITTGSDWTGPDDTENPLNWSSLQKTYYTTSIGILAFAVTVGTSMVTPATPEIAEKFHVSREASILTLTLYVLGLAFGPVIAAPISETYGRTLVYKITPPISMLFLVGSGFSKSFGSLLACRLLAGITGAPVVAVGAGSIADLYVQHKRASPMTTYIMMPFLGPAIGPIIGGFTAFYKSWPWTQWCTIFIGVIAYAMVLPMKETYKKVILMKRAKKHGIEGPSDHLDKGFAYLKRLLTITLVRPLLMLVTEPIVLSLTLYMSFTFSVLFAFFAAFPFTFESVYGFNTWQYGMTFLSVLVGVLLAAVTAVAIDKIVYQKKYESALKHGHSGLEPEHRLFAGMLGAFGVPVGLFWFAWTSRPSISWICPVLAGIPFAWGNLAIFLAGAMYLVDVYGSVNGASAIAANGLLRYTMSAVFPLFTFQLFENLGIAWAASLLGFVSVIMLPIPFVLFHYGKTIRSHSKYVNTKV